LLEGICQKTGAMEQCLADFCQKSQMAVKQPTRSITFAAKFIKTFKKIKTKFQL
jgi:hypothetical protein